MITRANFRIADLQMVRVYKSSAAFLVRIGEEFAVLKAENAVTGKKIRPNEQQDRFLISDRTAFANAMSATPAVKATIRMMATIFQYVTGDLGGLLTFTRQEESELGRWVRDQDIRNPAVLHANYQPGDPGPHGRGGNPDWFVWYIMEAYENLYDLEIAAKGQKLLEEGKKAVRKSICDLLKETPAFYERLGRILAVDIFNSNSDRFTYSEGDQCTWQLPNVFVTYDRMNFRFIGVDFFDPKLGAGYYGVPWDTIKGRLRGEYAFLLTCFRALDEKNAGLRMKIADSMLAALGRQTVLPTDSKAAKNAFRAGLTAGCVSLRQFYEENANLRAEWPVGLESRFRAAFGL